MIKIRLFVLFLFSYCSLIIGTQAENPSQKQEVANQISQNPQNKIFTINGQEKYMIGHILGALLDSKTNKFCTTSIVRYDAPNKRFIIEGDLRSISREALEHIGRDKFVYVPYYTMGKTDYSRSTYQKIGAIIVGTTDQTLEKELVLAALRGTLEEIKNAQQNQQKSSEAPQAKEVLKSMATVQACSF